jgi:hypothetical protein
MKPVLPQQPRRLFMAGKAFTLMRRRVLRENKHLIVRSARIGNKTKGRGLVFIRFSRVGDVHISYLTLEALINREFEKPGACDHREAIDKVSSYSLESEIPIMVTDGKERRFSVGIRQTKKRSAGRFIRVH